MTFYFIIYYSISITINGYTDIRINMTTKSITESRISNTFLRWKPYAYLLPSINTFLLLFNNLIYFHSVSNKSFKLIFI